MKNKFAAIIKASGISRRAGEDKLNYKINNKTLLETSIDSVEKSLVDIVLVIVNTKKHNLEEKYSNEKVRFIYNEYFTKGQSESIKLGTRSLDSNIEAAFYICADQPFIPYSFYNEMIMLYRESSIVVPRYKSKTASPCLFSKDFFKDLLSLEGESGGRSIIKNNSKNVIYNDIDDEKIFFDIDRYKDLLYAKKL